MPDHTYLFVRIKLHIAISDLVRDVRSCSTTFIKYKGWVKNFEWQDGFGAFSYSKSQAPNVIKYVLNQAEYHKGILSKKSI